MLCWGSPRNTIGFCKPLIMIYNKITSNTSAAVPVTLHSKVEGDIRSMEDYGGLSMSESGNFIPGQEFD